MCDPLTTGLILTAGSKGIDAYNTNRMLKAQDAEIARGIIQNSQEQRNADRRVNEQLASMSADSGEVDRATSLADFQAALRRGKDATETGLDATIGGDRFVERAGNARGRIQTAGQDMAERLATMTGLLRQRQREGSEQGRVRVDLAGTQDNINANQYLAQLRASSKRKNPWLDLASGLMGAYGSAVALRPPAVASGAAHSLGVPA